MDLKPGTRWKSAVCATEVVIVRSPTQNIVLECGGYPMAPLGSDPVEGLQLDSDFASGTAVGRRYADDEVGLEVLCSKAGAGTLAVDGRVIAPKDAKKLPASD